MRYFKKLLFPRTVLKPRPAHLSPSTGRNPLDSFTCRYLSAVPKDELVVNSSSDMPIGILQEDEIHKLTRDRWQRTLTESMQDILLYHGDHLTKRWKTTRDWLIERERQILAQSYITDSRIVRLPVAKDEQPSPQTTEETENAGGCESLPQDLPVSTLSTQEIDLSEMYDDETLRFLNAIDSFANDEEGDPNETDSDYSSNIELSFEEKDEASRVAEIKGENFHAESIMDKQPTTDGPSSLENSEYEDSRKLLAPLSLLRVVSASEWAAFDNDIFTEDSEQDDTHNVNRTSLPSFSSLDDTIASLPEASMNLSTADANLLLLNLALSTERTPDEILPSMMSTFQSMTQLRGIGVESSGPNEFTYEIFLLCSGRRLRASKSALDLVVADMVKTRRYSPGNLLITFDLCVECGNRQLAADILHDILQYPNRSFVIPNRVYSNMLKLLIPRGDFEEALNVMKTCLEENRRPLNKPVDDVLALALAQTKTHQSVPSIFLRKVFDLVSNDGVYTPGPEVLSRFVETCGKWYQHCDDTTALVRDILNFAMDRSISLRGKSIARIGLKASERIPDATLAHALSTEDCFRIGAPSNLVKTIEICVKCGEMVKAESLLASLRKIDSRLAPGGHALVLKGFAQQGDFYSTKRMFDEMREHGMITGDDLYGAVIHAHTRSNVATGDALELLENLTEADDNSSINVGAYTYGAVILSYVTKADWEMALSVHDDMVTRGVVPDSTTTYGLLLSAFKVGGPTRAHRYLERLLGLGVVPGKATCTLALRLLIPGLSRCSSTETMRLQLRDMIENRDKIFNEEDLLDLLRSLRVAEVEEGRKPTVTMSTAKLETRQQQAWRLVLETLLRMGTSTSS